jgi:hypothetical protein
MKPSTDFGPAGFSLSWDGVPDVNTGEGFDKWRTITDYSQTLSIPEGIPGGYRYFACLKDTIDGSTPDLEDTGWLQNISFSRSYGTGRLYTWEVAYMPPGGYFQCRGADAYGKGGIGITLSSGLAAGQQWFGFKDVSGVSSDGVAMAGPGQEVEIMFGTTGPADTYISETRWNAEGDLDLPDVSEYYDELKAELLEKAGTEPCPGCTGDLGTKEDTVVTWANSHKGVVYINSGDVSINTPFVLPDASKVIFVIADDDNETSNDLNINAGVWMTDQTDSFLAFIVEDDVNIDDGIGTNSNIHTDNVNIGSSYRDLEGVFLVNGNFTTSEGSGSENQLIVYGTVVANSIQLNRYNGAITPEYPMEIFRYNPRLLLLMPEVMMKSSIKWEQVLRPTPIPP